MAKTKLLPLALEVSDPALDMRREWAKSWTQAGALNQARADTAGLNEAASRWEQGAVARDMALNADLNPHYREALEAMPGLMTQIRELIQEDEALKVELIHSNTGLGIERHQEDA